MSQVTDTMVDYRKAIADIDKAIIALNNGQEDLLYLRHQMIARIYDMDEMELMGVLKKNEGISKEVVEIIGRVVDKKYKHLDAS